MKPVVLDFKSGAISHWAHSRNVTPNFSVYPSLAQNEQWEIIKKKLSGTPWYI